MFGALAFMFGALVLMFGALGACWNDSTLAIAPTHPDGIPILQRLRQSVSPNPRIGSHSAKHGV
jgi:hypothetical protein